MNPDDADELIFSLIHVIVLPEERLSKTTCRLSTDANFIRFRWFMAPDNWMLFGGPTVSEARSRFSRAIMGSK